MDKQGEPQFLVCSQWEPLESKTDSNNIQSETDSIQRESTTFRMQGSAPSETDRTKSFEVKPTAVAMAVITVLVKQLTKKALEPNLFLSSENLYKLILYPYLMFVRFDGRVL